MIMMLHQFMERQKIYLAILKKYTSVDDKEELKKICDTVENRINFTSIYDVNKVTPDVVREAYKSDPLLSFSTDCIKNGSDKLFYLLSLLIKSFLMHHHVTLFLLLATLVPIIKDKLGRNDSSKNYSSLAKSSIILKLAEIFSCAMDTTKAFDLIMYSLLFWKLLQARFPPIFIRVLLFIHAMQYRNV